MSLDTAVIAGPITIDTLPQGEDLLGGGAIYAAAAASAFVPTQLWARVGEDFPEQLRAILERRRIDCAGMVAEGSTLHYAAGDGIHGDGPALPSVDPTDATGVGATLAVGLDEAETRRALTAFSHLPDRERRLQVVSLDRETVSADMLQWCAEHSDVLIAPMQSVDQCLPGTGTLERARSLISAGARCVLLRAGISGGLCVYKGKACTWNAAPIIPKDPTGISSAFAGSIAGWCAEHGHLDLRGLKRGIGYASAIASACAGGVGPKSLFTMSREHVNDLFTRLRRLNKA